jgi:hypothetical protein
VGNPIADMTAAGIAPQTKALKVTPPAAQFDGARCNVYFDGAPGAKSYDVWVSPYPDGTGAVRPGKDWKMSGQLISGLQPETDFCLFVVYTDKDGKLSKSSKALKFRLKDTFAMK